MVPLPVLLSGSTGGPAGAGVAAGMLMGSRRLVTLETSYVWALEFVQDFILCEKRLLLFFFCMQGGFFMRGSLHGPTELLSRNLFAVLGG